MRKIIIINVYMKIKNVLSSISLLGCLAFAVGLTTVTAGNTASWKTLKTTSAGWGSIDVRYPSDVLPVTNKSLKLNAWKGERVAAQALLMAPRGVKKMTFSVSDLKGSKGRIASGQMKAYYVGYAMTDAFKGKNGKTGCAGRSPEEFDSSRVADRLYAASEVTVGVARVQPVWLDIRVPRTTAAGIYKGTVEFNCDGRKLSLPLSVTVANRTLPEPKDWAFHLDLWQNPYAVARYWNVPLWSKEHFDRMRPLMKSLAEAGQKVITCSIIQHPWNGQTYDAFESMILKMKKLDGTWTYDYSVFDKWVEFMMSCGITAQIDCYTIVPWHYRFDYYDMASNSTKIIACKPGEKAYEDFMLSFLTDFAKHLKAKGWFSRTCIAMDERPMEQLRTAYDIVKRADPDFRIEGAAHYYPEIEPKMYDISLVYEDGLIPAEALKARKAAGLKTTFYTCCGPERPNTFTFSAPAESAWMGWHAAAIGYDGYLRWAYNSWTKDPLKDTRFRAWPAGDCFLVYPDGSSIRFERLVHGIQDFEKIQILKRTLNAQQLQKLDRTLKRFAPVSYDPQDDAALLVREAEAVLRSLE